MTGREEKDLKWDKRCRELLKGCPSFLHEYYNSTDMSVRSLYTYLTILKKFFDFTCKQPIDVTLLDVDNYIAEIGNKFEKKSCKALSYSALKSFFSWASTRGYINNNPLIDMKKPKVPKKENAYRTDALTPEELRIFMDNVRYGVGSDKAIAFQDHVRERDIAMALMFVNLGVRLSAVVELNINDVDFDNNSIVVITKGFELKRFENVPYVCDAIKDWLKTREKFKPKTSAVFITERGTRMSDQAIREVIRKYGSGIDKEITPHKLRATFASLLSDSGVSVEDLRLLMGHKSIETTLIYIRNRKIMTAAAEEYMMSKIN